MSMSTFLLSSYFRLSFLSGSQRFSRRCWRIKSTWTRKRRRRRSTSSSWRGRERCCHRRVCGRSQQWLHRRPVPLLLQPGAAIRWTLGRVPTVPAQPATLSLPTTHFLLPQGVLRLSPPIPAHWDIREQGWHRMPAVPWDTGATRCSRHSRWPGTAGEVWGVPAEAFSGCWSRYTLVPCAWLQVRTDTAPLPFNS